MVGGLQTEWRSRTRLGGLVLTGKLRWLDLPEKCRVNVALVVEAGVWSIHICICHIHIHTYMFIYLYTYMLVYLQHVYKYVLV